MDEDSVVSVLDHVVSSIKKRKLIYRPYVSVSVYEIPGGMVYRATGDMPNADGDIVGTVRIEVYAPLDEMIPTRIRIEWTRDAFGFWYREDLFIVNSIDEWMEDMKGMLFKPIKMIESTSRGTVKVSSMNLGLKKIRKNKNKDAIFDNGMRLW